MMVGIAPEGLGTPASERDQLIAAIGYSHHLPGTNSYRAGLAHATPV